MQALNRNYIEEITIPATGECIYQVNYSDYIHANLPAMEIPSVPAFIGRITNRDNVTTTFDVDLDDIFMNVLESPVLTTSGETSVEVNDSVTCFSVLTRGGTATTENYTDIYDGHNLLMEPYFNETMVNMGRYTINEGAYNTIANDLTIQYPDTTEANFMLQSNIVVKSKGDDLFVGPYDVNFIVTHEDNSVSMVGTGEVIYTAPVMIGYTIRTNWGFLVSQARRNPSPIKKVEVALMSGFTTYQSVTVAVPVVNECEVKSYIQFVDENGGICCFPMRGRLKRGNDYDRWKLANYKGEKRTYLVGDTPQFTVNTGWLKEDLANQLVRQIQSSKSVVLYDVEKRKTWNVLQDTNTFSEKYFDEEHKLINYSLTFEANKDYLK